MIWIVASLITGGMALLLFLYFLQKGQFDEIEEVKYQLFREDEEEE